MTAIAIHVEGLSKQYRIGDQSPQRDLRETLTDAVSGTWRRLHSRARDPGHDQLRKDNLIWALKDVSFQVEMGQAVGVIGNNGSGKSTLLKILSRIVEPTEGFADIRGRVGSLLEVGSGFNFELSGRENIFLSGAILGMHQREIERKLDEIVAFAGVQRFIDTPVKHYSTGMYMRLAFAVAAHLETEILLVDEVLAVGDAAFQKKCLAKMEDVTHQGRTIFLVSHSVVAIQSLCDQVIWLRDGKIAAHGPPSEIIPQYTGTETTVVTERIWEDFSSAPGTEKIKLHRVTVEPERSDASEVITIHSSIRLEVEYWNLVPDAYLNLGIHLYKEPGILVFTSLPVHEPEWHGRRLSPGLFRSTCRIPANLLNTGRYGFQLVFMEHQASVVFYLNDAVVFEAHEEARQGGWYGEWGGVVRPDLNWTTEFLHADVPSLAANEAQLWAARR